MTLPASNFNVSTLGSVVVGYGTNGAHTCRSDGFSVLADLQARLIERLASGPLPSVGGGTVSQAEIAVVSQDPTAGWGGNVLRGLYALAKVDHVTADGLAAIAADLAALSARQPLSARTTQIAVWEAGLNGGFTPAGERVWGIGASTSVTFGAGTQYPIAGSVPPRPTNGSDSNGIVCSATTGGTISPQTGIAAFVERNVGLLVGLMVLGAVVVVAVNRDAPTMRRIRSGR